jgi:hypothetical protein
MIRGLVPPQARLEIRRRKRSGKVPQAPDRAKEKTARVHRVSREVR